jgi:hypothetical protein
MHFLQLVKNWERLWLPAEKGRTAACLFMCAWAPNALRSLSLIAGTRISQRLQGRCVRNAQGIFFAVAAF